MFRQYINTFPHRAKLPELTIDKIIAAVIKQIAWTDR